MTHSMKNVGITHLLIAKWIQFENPTSNVFNKQNIFWKKKFAILNCTRFLSHPTAHYKENKFFWIVHTRRTKIIEKDIGTPHTPYFRLSQMYYNRYMPGFASVPTDKALKKIQIAILYENNPNVKLTI